MVLRRPTTTDRRPDYIIPSDSDELIAWLEKRRGSTAGRINDVQMRLNLAYTLGHQTVVWDPSSKRLRRAEISPQDPNPPNYVKINKIGGIVERTISKLTKNVPVPECRPVSNDDDDVSAARVGSRILDHEMNRLEWEDRLIRLYSWVLPLGWAYLYCCWNPALGESVGNFEGEDLSTGEIDLEIVPPFELMVDPNARRFEDARWCIRTMAMTREAVWETYGKDPEGAEMGRTLADEVYSLATPQGLPVASNSPSIDFVMVHQYWLRPKNRSRPAGMVVTWAGRELLETPRDFPYEHGRLPFVQFELLPGMGTHEGRTWVTDLIDMQKDYNDARSREATLRRIMVPHLVGPAGSVDPSRLGTRVSWIGYNAVGAEPKWMIPDNRWAYQHEQAMQRSDMEMGERAGQAEVSQGRAPAGAPAAAILALQEADDTKLAITAKLLARGVAGTGRQILSLVRQYWEEDRLVRAWSEEDSRLEVAHFSKANIAAQMDVHVSSESALPRSKSARAQLVMDLVQRGILSDPRYILRLLQMPGTDWLTEQMDRDTEQARRENDKLMFGQDVQVAPWHVHAVHVIAHDDLRKTVDYERAEPEIRAVIDAHATAHYEALGIKMLPPPVAPGMAPPGAGGGGGPGYLDPMTGQPSSPLERAAGQAPPARDLAQAAGIGGVGRPGDVPGASRDQIAGMIGD